MWISIILLLISIGGIFFGVKFLYNWSGGGSTELKESRVPTPQNPVASKVGNTKERKYFTVIFKVKKKIKDGEAVKPYSVPESNAINFYEKNSYGGEGFIHKEYNKKLWTIIKAKRDISATIVRTDKNEAYIKVLYK